MSSSSVSSSSSFSSDSLFPEDSDHDDAQQQQHQQNDKEQQQAPKSTFPPPSIKDVVCHYQVLGIESSADSSIIKKAYRRLALQYHPDKQMAVVQDDATTTTTTTTTAAAAAAASLMAHENFRRLQEAYECLMDPSERRWYDDHREAIVRGWTSRSTRSGDHHQPSMDLDDIVVDVMPYMNSMCYRGYAHPSQDHNSFYFVYANVFERIVQGELRGSSSTTTFQLPTHFGHADTDWDQVSAFYMAWLSFSTQLSFSWVDLYDTVHDADHRRIRRAMQDANHKVRKGAKKSRNEDVLALVRHVQRRDPRVQNYHKQQDTAQKERQATIQAKAQERKQQAKVARQLWQQQAEQDIAAQEEQDRLAGRIRLADLQDDNDDDYEYNVGKGKKKKKKKSKKKLSDNNNNNNNKGAINDEDDEIHQVDDSHASAVMPIRADASNQDNNTNKTIGNDNQGHNGVQSLRQPVAGMDKTLNDVDPSSLSFKVEISDEKDTTEVDDLESDENGNDDDEINVWHCECCRKDFKSVGQMENHMKSKKHKETYKRYQKKFEQEILQGMLDNME